MNTNSNNQYRIGYRLMVVLSILAMVLGGQSSVSVSAQASSAAPLAATTSTMTLSVVSAANSSLTFNNTLGNTPIYKW